MTEAQVNEPVQLALATIGDVWHEDNVTYSWLHAKWSQARDRPRPKVWRKQIKQLKVDVLTALTVLRQPAVRTLRNGKGLAVHTEIIDYRN